MNGRAEFQEPGPQLGRRNGVHRPGRVEPAAGPDEDHPVPVGVENPDSRSDIPRYDRPMLSLLYLVVRALVRLLASGGQLDRDDVSKDLEILVIGRQLRVLQRRSGRRPSSGGIASS